MIYDKVDVEQAEANAGLDLQYVDINSTKCKQCNECETYEYERYDRNDNLQSFIYCKGNKDEVELSNWFIQKDGYAYSTRKIQTPHYDDKKKTLFHTLFKNNKNRIIDHINGVRNDNRLRNLQEVSDEWNNQNYHHKRTSIFPGVYWSRKMGKYVAQYGNRRKESNVRIGFFDDELEAFHAYVKRLESDGKTVNPNTMAWSRYVEWLGERNQSKLIVE